MQARGLRETAVPPQLGNSDSRTRRRCAVPLLWLFLRASEDHTGAPKGEPQSLQQGVHTSPGTGEATTNLNVASFYNVFLGHVTNFHSTLK